MIKFDSVEIEGFRSYGERQIVDLSTPGIVLVTGENRDRGVSQAAGKSTIFKAIQTALFEENDDDSVKDRGINVVQKKKGMYISLRFRDERNVQYNILYTRKHPEYGDEWGVWEWNAETQEWMDKRGEKHSDTRDIIYSITKLTNVDFTNLLYSRQFSISEFITATPLNKSDIFAKSLGLNYSDEWREKIREKKQVNKTKLIKLEEKTKVLINIINNTVDQLINILHNKQSFTDITHYLATFSENLLSPSTEELSGFGLNKKSGIYSDIHQSCFLEAKSRLESKLKELTNLLDNINAQIDITESDIKKSIPLQQLVNSITERNERVHYTQNAYQSATEELCRLLPACKEYDTQIEYMSQIESDQRFLKETLVDLEQKYSRIYSSISSAAAQCDECQQEITGETKEGLIRHYADKIELKKKMIADLEVTIRDIKNEVAIIFPKRNIAMNLQGRLSRLVEERDAAIIALNDATSRLESVRVVFGEAPDIVLEKIPGWQSQVAVHKAKKEQVMRQIADEEHAISILDDFIKNLETMCNDLQETQSEVCALTAAGQHLSLADDLIMQFRTYKIESSRDAFNASLAQYLGIMTDGEVEATLVTQMPKSKGKGMKSEIEIIVKEGEKEGVAIRQYSGGEKTTLSLALTAAFWDLANSQAANGVNILLLDEPFGMVDRYSEEKACQFFQYLKSLLGRTIFVITNRSSLRETGVFDREIRAVKENHLTHLEHYDLSGEH